MREPIRQRRVICAAIDTTLRVHPRSEEHTSELQSRGHLVCRLLLEKKKAADEVHSSAREIGATTGDVARGAREQLGLIGESGASGSGVERTGEERGGQ